MTPYLIILGGAMLGGIVQVLSGFGCGIVIMIFLPHLFPIPQAATISNMITIFLITSYAIEYRKYVQLRTFPVPAVFYAAFSAAAITISAHWKTDVLKPYYGLFLVAVALYFAFVAKNLKWRAGGKTAVICASLSGLSQGFFGISGPPLALYFLLISECREEYIGNMQVFALFTSLFALIVRVMNHTVQLFMIPMVAVGLLGVFLGKRIGNHFIHGIELEKMKRIVYLFLGLSGLWTFISNYPW